MEEEGSEIKTFMKELEKFNSLGHYTGQLIEVWKSLRMYRNDPLTSKVTTKPLRKNKTPPLTYKMTGMKWGRLPFISDPYRTSWVIKFSPKDKQDDPWYDVYEEYSILKSLYGRNDNPVPEPLHCSSEAERRAVGTKFIIMSFVEGKSYPSATGIPEAHRKTAFSSVMRALAKVHRQEWVTELQKDKREHQESSTFWHSQVKCWKRNYDGTSLGNPENDGTDHPNNTDKFFTTMVDAIKRSDGESQVIHGDMDISNIIFDDKFNVKAIIDWKLGKINGDPMVDVAYFCMMFLRPDNYGHQYKPINDHPLLIGNGRQLEETVLDVYKTNCSYTFSSSLFLYAKAVCCLRLLSVLKAAVEDDFQGHAIGTHEKYKKHSQLVVDCLTAAGKDYYRRSNL